MTWTGILCQSPCKEQNSASSGMSLVWKIVSENNLHGSLMSNVSLFYFVVCVMWRHCENLLQGKRMHQPSEQFISCVSLSFTNQCSHGCHPMWQQECVGTWAFCSLPAVHAIAPWSISWPCDGLSICPKTISQLIHSLQSISRASPKDLTFQQNSNANT